MTDTTLFSVKFDELLACKLAADLAKVLTNDATHAKNLHDKYIYDLSQARSFDAQEGTAPVLEIDDFLNERF